MPNKTIYVSDDDLAVYQRAQEFTAGNLSAAIAIALRRYVDFEEGRLKGFDEVVVRIGPGQKRKQRFLGVLLGEWSHSTTTRSGGDLQGVPLPEGEVRRLPHAQQGVDDRRRREAEGLACVDEQRAELGCHPRLCVARGRRHRRGAREVLPAEPFAMLAGLLDEPTIEDLDI